MILTSQPTQCSFYIEVAENSQVQKALAPVVVKMLLVLMLLARLARLVLLLLVRLVRLVLLLLLLLVLLLLLLVLLLLVLQLFFSATFLLWTPKKEKHQLSERDNRTMSM